MDSSDKHHIVILDGNIVNPGDLSWDGFRRHGSLTVYEDTPSSQVLERIADAEIVLANRISITQDILARTSIKFIGLFSTGYNLIDIQAAEEKGVVVSNVPSYGGIAVAQFTFALLLELCHFVQRYSDLIHEGQWITSHFQFWKYPQIELFQKTIGIIGYGDIGQRVAKIAQSFGMKVLVHTRTVREDMKNPNIQFVSLEELCRNSDVISIHVPLFKGTKKLINQKTISYMRPHTLVINTARGAIVDEHDMREALVQKKIGGFACDVVSQEPIVAENPLLHAPNCIITPHIAWIAKETRQRLLDIAAENVECFLKGSPQNVVSG